MDQRAGVDDDPIIPIVDGIVARLRTHAQRPDATLTCDDLLDMIGHHSHVLAIMIFALLNLLPGPPGYNLLMALATFLLSIAMARGRPMRFASWLGKMRLPIRIIRKLLEVLAVIVGWAARISHPRWHALTRGHALPVIAAICIFLGFINISPVPFMNLIPSAALAIICMGLLNQDGLTVVWGIAIGALGTAVSAIATVFLISIALALGDMVDGAPM